MTWTRAEMLRDATEVVADYREYVADQYRQAAWEASEGDLGTDVRGDTGPCRECYPPVPAHLRAPDPWDDLPVVHPTRFDLPVSTEPPF